MTLKARLFSTILIILVVAVWVGLALACWVVVWPLRLYSYKKPPEPAQVAHPGVVIEHRQQSKR